MERERGEEREGERWKGREEGMECYLCTPMTLDEQTFVFPHLSS